LLSVAIPAQQTLACSRYVMEAFRGAWRSKREVLLVYNGVMVPEREVGDAAGTVRREFEVREGAPLVVMASRLQRWKGVHVFVEAAACLAQRFPDARFLVVGGSLFGLEPGYARELRLQVDRLALRKALVLAGHRTDMFRIFAAADVVVHSSIEPDPFPTVLLEAMALARPVVASRLGGPTEIVDDGVTGFLLTPGDPDQLARAIFTLLNDPALRVRMGQAGVARVRARFSAAAMARGIEDVYASLIA